MYKCPRCNSQRLVQTQYGYRCLDCNFEFQPNNSNVTSWLIGSFGILFLVLVMIPIMYLTWNDITNSNLNSITYKSGSQKASPNQSGTNQTNTDLANNHQNFEDWKSKRGRYTEQPHSQSQINPTDVNSIGASLIPSAEHKDETDAERFTRETNERIAKERDEAIKQLQSEAATKFEAARSTAQNAMEQQKALDAYNKEIAEGMAKIPGTIEYKRAQALAKYEAYENARQARNKKYREEMRKNYSELEKRVQKELQDAQVPVIHPNRQRVIWGGHAY